MDFRAIIIFLFIYFIRPQDWVMGMSGMNIVRPIMAFAILAMVIRPQKFSPKSLFRTPHDWAVLAYGIFIVSTSPGPAATLSGILALLAFYFVTNQALSDSSRIATFLAWWIALLLTITAMAVASEHGIDPTDSKDITHKIPEHPRLVLNTYLFDNPNSLGHTVVLAIPAIYLLLFWKRPFFCRLASLPLIALAAYCTYLTQSKGAFLVGAGVIFGGFVFGRPKVVQFVLLALALTAGTSLVSQLPRMQELSKARSNEAIMGRLLAWEIARTASKENFSGEGWKKFTAMIEFEKKRVEKATHSAYVKVGADLGYGGLFFYIGVLYCCVRSLFQGSFPDSVQDERSRRILFVLLLGYILSGWMIDRAYHTEFFLLAAVGGALHRQRLGLQETTENVQKSPPETRRPLRKRHTATPLQPPPPPTPLASSSGQIAGETQRWLRPGLLDITATVSGVWIVVAIWDYILKNF